MMPAIKVRYLPPTDYQGARLKAVCDREAVTIPFPYELDHAEGKQAAAQALLDKLGWDHGLVGGWLPDGSTVFVLTGERHQAVES